MRLQGSAIYGAGHPGCVLASGDKHRFDQRRRQWVSRQQGGGMDHEADAFLAVPAIEKEIGPGRAQNRRGKVLSGSQVPRVHEIFRSVIERAS